MRQDLQHKPYEAVRVRSGGKCWSPSDIENDFKRVKQRCNVSEQRAGCAWDWTDEQRCRWKWTAENPRGHQAGRMGKAKIMMMMMMVMVLNMYRETT